MAMLHGHQRLLRFTLVTMAFVALVQLQREVALLLDGLTWTALHYTLRAKPLALLYLLAAPMVVWSLETSHRYEKQLRRENQQLRKENQTTKVHVDDALAEAATIEKPLRDQLRSKDRELQQLSQQLQQAHNKYKGDLEELNKNYRDFYHKSHANLSERSDDAIANNHGSRSNHEHRQELLHERLKAYSATLKPVDCLDLVTKYLFLERFHVPDKARRSAKNLKDFQHVDQLFDLLWKLANDYWQYKCEDISDKEAAQIFGNAYAATESESIKRDPKAKQERTFDYEIDGNPRTVRMLQHLKIGVKDSDHHTLRLHFYWDQDHKKIIIGHCGAHLHSPSH